MVSSGFPVYRGFEYRVRLAVSIPLAWAELLRDVALHHYDHWCRQSAKAGVVNALRNTACDSEHPSSYPVEWRDLDLLAKIMEQSRYYAVSAQAQACAAEINAWICQAKSWLVEREEALAKWDSEQGAPCAPFQKGCCEAR
jgi:hypothetical protein